MSRNLKLEVLLAAVDRATAPLKKIANGSSGAAAALKASRDELRKLQDAQKNLSSFKNMQSQVKSTNDKLADARNRLKDLSAELKRTDAPTEAFQRKFIKAHDAVQKLEQAQQAQRRQLISLKSELQSAGVSTTKLDQSERSLGDSIVRANKQLEAQKDKLKQVAAQQRRLDQARSAYDKTRSTAGSMMGTGAGYAATGAAKLYAGARVLQPGVEFGAAMSYVQALTRLDKDDPRLAALKDQARELGASTSFSATEAAEAMGLLGMAGFDPKAIKAAMPGMLDLAKANKTDLGQTADIASNILSGFGIDPSQMNRVGDVLTATTTRANVNLAMLGDTMKYVAPVARSLGVSLEESAAMAGMLGNVGIQGSQAGTSMRAIIGRLSSQTGKAKDMMEKLGVATRDASGNMRNVPSIIADISRATEKMGTAERFEYLKVIFGEEPAAAIAELIERQGTKGIEKFVGILTNAAGENAKVAKVMADNVQGDLSSLQSAWEEVGIAIESSNNGAIRGLIQSVTEMIRKTGEWVKANPELAATITKVVAGLAALMVIGGGLMMAIGALLIPLATLKYSLSVLGIKSLPLVGAALKSVFGLLLANPIGLIITAIAAGALLIWQNWETLQPYFAAMWNGIKSVFSAGWEIIKKVFSWTPLGLIIENWGPIASWFNGLIDKITGAFKGKFSGLIDTLLAPVRALRGVWDSLFGSDETSGKLADAVDSARKAAGAIAVGTAVAATPAMADALIDTRPPITASVGGAGGNSIGAVHITVQAAPGMNEAQLARLVAAEVEKLNRNNAARQRSALYDTE